MIIKNCNLYRRFLPYGHISLCKFEVFQEGYFKFQHSPLTFAIRCCSLFKLSYIFGCLVEFLRCSIIFDNGRSHTAPDRFIPSHLCCLFSRGSFTLVSASPQRQERRLGTSHLRGVGFGFSSNKVWFMIR